jgi:small subunit ribosomal protein S6
MLMLHPETAEERQAEIQARLRSTVEDGKGTIIGLDDWGRRKLAYEIKGQTEGLYSVHTFSAGPETLAEVERQLGITDEVMRFMTTRPPVRSPKPE